MFVVEEDPIVTLCVALTNELSPTNAPTCRLCETVVEPELVNGEGSDCGARYRSRPSELTPITRYVPAFVPVTVTCWPPMNPSLVQLPLARWIVSWLPAFVFAARVKVYVPVA